MTDGLPQELTLSGLVTRFSLTHYMLRNPYMQSGREVNNYLNAANADHRQVENKRIYYGITITIRVGAWQHSTSRPVETGDMLRSLVGESYYSYASGQTTLPDHAGWPMVADGLDILAEAEGIDALIIGLLEDARQTVRAGTAEWLLGRRIVAGPKDLKKARFDKLAWLGLAHLPHVEFINGKQAPPDMLKWWIFNSWINYDTQRQSLEDCTATAKQQANIQWASTKKWYPDWTEQNYITMLVNNLRGTYPNSGAASKGILGLAKRIEPTLGATKVRQYLRDQGKRTSQASALLDLMAAMVDPVSLQVVIAAATRLKQKSVQKAAGQLAAQDCDQAGRKPSHGRPDPKSQRRNQICAGTNPHQSRRYRHAPCGGLFWRTNRWRFPRNSLGMPAAPPKFKMR